jgi:hypothetical protein
MRMGQAVQTPLLQHFPGGVFLQDGSVISLPDELKTSWQGCGGGPGESRECSAHPGPLGNAVWRAVRALAATCQEDATGREPQCNSRFQNTRLSIVDTAYLTYASMRTASQTGRYWITGVKANMVFLDGQGHCWNLTEWLGTQPAKPQVVDVWVRAGQPEQVKVALDCLALAQRGCPTTKATGQQSGGRASALQRRAAVGAATQASGRPSTPPACSQAPQGQCKQTEAT